MADYELKSDEEKAEELKAWWRENGLSVAAGIALTIGGMFGWNQWKAHKLTQAEGASRLYAQIQDNQAESGEAQKRLMDDYSSTAYASLLALRQAKNDCEAGSVDACIKQLEAASESSQESLVNIAKLRLARAYISTGKLNEAESILTEKMPSAYQSLIDELKGDIHFAKKEYKQARDAYDRAILSSAGQNTQLIKLKRDDLGDHLKGSNS